SGTKKTRLQVDKKPPKLRFAYDREPLFKEPGSGLPVFPGGVLVYLAAQDEETEVDRVTYTLNGGPEVLYRNPLTHFEAGKMIVLKALAVDRLQNRSQVTLKFRVGIAKTGN
ncbi:MAG: hypothetical protein GY950_08165, partial [bacterium]|nr:hypothetical protein [bacterium]